MRSVRSAEFKTAEVDQNTGRRNILIIGTDFRNQGAYLMMVAAINEIKQRFAGTPVLSFKVGSPLQRRRVGALTMLPVSSRMPHTTVSKTLWAKGGVVDYRDIDVVFDASGFFYSDSWKQFVGGRADLLQTFGDLEIPVYFLPQAFGPFEFTSEACAAALSVGRAAYARDPTSQGYLESLATEHAISTRIDTAPDFTCLIKGGDADWSDLSGAVPIVPNYNIVGRAPTADHAKNYVRNLAEFVLAARDAGRYVYGLSHEGRKDTQLLREVAKQVGDLRIIEGFDGVELKALLGSSQYAIVGRFHAAVSCLSQATPLIAHGWSHKYKHLMEDFHQERRLLDPFVKLSPAEVKKHIEELENFAGADRVELERCGDADRRRSLSMWEEIQQDVLN